MGVGSGRRGQTESGGVCSLPGISFAPWEKGWGSPRSPLCAHPGQGGEKGWLGSAPSFSPAPWGSRVRPGAASYPHARHRPPPARAGVLPWPWHGVSLIMAMGPKRVVGEKGALGPRSTAHGPCHHLECGAQHHRVLVPLVQDRQTGSRDGVRWGGSGWLAWCAGTWCAAAVGVLIPPMLSQRSRTLPHCTGKPPGLLPPRADGATRQCHPPCPRGTLPPGSQHPWRPVSLCTSYTPRKGLQATTPPQPLLGHQTE